MDPRRAELEAAAEALRGWVYARRATWNGAPAEVLVDDDTPAPVPFLTESAPITPPIAPPTPPPTAPPTAYVDTPLPPSTMRDFDDDPFADFGNAPPPDFNTEPAPSALSQIAAHAKSLGHVAQRARSLAQIPEGARSLAKIPERARSLGAPLMRWSLRAVAAVVLIAVVAGAGLAARSYWGKLTAPKLGTAVLESVPTGSQVVIDGILEGRTPLSKELVVGRHVVELHYRNSTRKLEINVATGTPTVSRIDWTAKPTGRLQVNSDPAGANVIIDGRARGFTPLTLDDLTVGSHTVVLETVRGSVRRTVTIASDRPAQISESIYAGWLKVVSPIDLEIHQGTRVIRLDDRNQALLPPGSLELRFENRALEYREVRRVELNPGEITSVSIVPPPSALTVTATLPAEVSIDGERVGETPLTDHPVSLGTRDITVKSATGVERHFTMTVTVKPVRIEVDFSKP